MRGFSPSLVSVDTLIVIITIVIILGSLDDPQIIKKSNCSPIVEKEETGHGTKHQNNCQVKFELLIFIFISKPIQGKQGMKKHPHLRHELKENMKVSNMK